MKTSVNVPKGLATYYQNNSTLMKKAIFETKFSSVQDSELHTLYKKYKICTINELFDFLCPNPTDRKEMKNIKFHLPNTSFKKTVLSLSKEVNFSKGFVKLLLLHYARHTTIDKVRKQATDYYNTVVASAHTAEKITDIPNTGINVVGNKKWFLGEYRKIISCLPSSVNTFVEPFMGSGTVTLDTCHLNRFIRIITNDIWWQKTNYISALFKNAELLRYSCFDLTPSQNSYNFAFHATQKSIVKAKTDIDLAALYHLKNYCENHFGVLLPKKLLENNNKASEKYLESLDYICDIPPSAKKVLIYNDDALNIIKKYNRKNHFLFVDPPYPHTKGYEHSFTMEDFENIVNATLNFNGYFLFCCRITEKHANINTHIDTYSLSDLKIKNIIDNLFYGHGLYYKDFLYNRSGVAIERVISNFPFDGCSDYDTPIQQ